MEGEMDGGKEGWREGWTNGSRKEWMDVRDVADISSHSTATSPSPPPLLVQGPWTTSNITYRGSEETH